MRDSLLKICSKETILCGYFESHIGKKITRLELDINSPRTETTRFLYALNKYKIAKYQSWYVQGYAMGYIWLLNGDWLEIETDPVDWAPVWTLRSRPKIYQSLYQKRGYTKLKATGENA